MVGIFVVEVHVIRDYKDQINWNQNIHDFPDQRDFWFLKGLYTKATAKAEEADKQ